MELTYRYRLYPSKAQLQMIQETCGCVRFLYNRLLELRTKNYRETKIWADFDADALVQRNPFLTKVDPSALHWAESQLEQAYRRFFRARNQEPNKYRPDSFLKSQVDPAYQLMDNDLVGYPRFKSKKQTARSYTTSNETIKIENGRVDLPGVGRVKIKMHRLIPENASCKHYTVLEKASGHVFLLVCIELPDVERRKDLHKALGVVFDPSHLAIRSDTVKVHFQHEDRKLQKRIRREYKALLRKKPGSNHYEEQRKHLASLIEKQTNQRHDCLHKIARQITNDADTIYMETPDVRLRRARWAVFPGTGRMITDESWWHFSELVRYKAAQEGKFFWKVPAAYPLYSLCSACDRRVPKILKQSDWQCPRCGEKMSSEHNAALNLERLGVKYILEQRGIPS